jgi:hypothetical protein
MDRAGAGAQALPVAHFSPRKRPKYYAELIIDLRKLPFVNISELCNEYLLQLI